MPLVYDGYDIGHISLIEDPTGIINANIVFDGDTQVFDGIQGWSELQCSFTAELEYNYDVGGGSIENHTVLLLGKEVTVNVPENSVIAEVEKTGVRNGKFIDWVVEAEASQGNGNFDLVDFVFTDNLSNVGSYVTGTFKAGTTANISEATLPIDNFAETTTGIEYKFPENSTGKRYLFFRTEIKDDVFYNNGDKTVTNTATVKKGNIFGTGTGQVTFTSEWITKALDGTFDPTNRNISWNIEANHLGASLNSAVITDALDAKLDFVSASWQEWDQTANDGEGAWETAVAIIPTAAGDFELGTINSKVRLNIKAKVKSEYNTEHEIQGISNTATLSWQDSTEIVSNTVESNIGFNPIVKKYIANSVDYTNHTMDWEVTVKASDENNHLRVLDILVYGGSTLNLNTVDELVVDSGKNRLTQITKAELAGITQNRNLKYADEFNGNGNLEVTVHKLINTVSGKPVADVLVVTAVGGTQIDVASGDKTFTFKTQITDPNIYAVNEDNYINNSAFLMKTVIDSINNTLESNEVINRANARVQYKSRMLAKDILNISNNDLIEPNKNSVGAGVDKNKGFDYKDGTAVFRLHVNANGITDLTGDITPTDEAVLGNVVVTDTLPAGWEFVEIGAGKDFLLYEGSSGDDQGRLVAGDIVENPSFVTGDFSVGGKATFTFTTVDKPYIIYVKAKVTDEKYKEYFSINQTYNDENTVVLSATDYDNLSTQKQKILIRSSVLSKEASLIQAGEVEWTVTYNPYTIDHGDVEILDVLPVGIDIRIDSNGNLDLTNDNIKVTQYDTLNTDGTLSGPSQIVLIEDDNIFYDNEARELKFRIPDSSKAYEFVYKTDVTGSPGSSLSNSVKLVGYDYESPGNNAQYQVSAADTNATMRKSGWVEITKYGSNNEVKAGAEFKIVTLDRATTIRTGITNSSGKLFLRGLPVGDYLLIETVAPVGYSISPIAYEVSVIADGNDIKTSIDGKTGEGQNTISVKNTLEGTAGNLTVRKVLEGNATDDNKDFDFTLEIAGLNGEYSYEGSGGKTNGVINFVNGEATFKLKGGESIKIIGIAKDLEYIVTETNYSAEGYITTRVEEDVKVIVADETKTETFTNARNTGGLVVTKNLEGNATDPNKEFEFTLVIPELNGDFNYEGLGGKADGSITFTEGIANFTLKGGESIKITEFLDGLKYTVTETDYSAEGYITSMVGEDIKFITKDITKTETFTNARNTGVLVVEKVLKGNETDAN
ncbi:MAG: hypothetical protein GX078_09455, partial [Clostridiales bacterium]|nr:hypothetical protein [Clostridiales bacterium]